MSNNFNFRITGPEFLDLVNWQTIMPKHTDFVLKTSQIHSICYTCTVPISLLRSV